MSRYYRRGDGYQAQQWNDDRNQRPSYVRHGATESGFAQSARIGGAQEWSNELAIDPFLEYVRADGQCDDYQREDCPI